VLATAIPDNGL